MVESVMSTGCRYAKLAGMDRSFADLIRRTREARGMKSYRLAELIGKRPSLISRIENGDYKDTPPPDVIAGLAMALDIPQGEILESLGYRIAEDSPPYDPDAAQIARAIAKLTERERRIVLNLMETASRDIVAIREEPEGERETGS